MYFFVDDNVYFVYGHPQECISLQVIAHLKVIVHLLVDGSVFACG